MGKALCWFGVVVMITSIEQDGTSMGLDLRLIENACRKYQFQSLVVVVVAYLTLRKGFDTGASAIEQEASSPKKIRIQCSADHM